VTNTGLVERAAARNPGQAARKLLLAAGGVVVVLLLLLLILRVVGLDPKDYHPGLWVTGEIEETPVADWSFLPENGLMAIQSREWFFPPLAHSVTTAYTIVNKKLYVPSLYAAGLQFPIARHWNKNVDRDPHVRLKLNDKLYDLVFARVTDPAEYELLRQSFVTRSPDLGSPGLHFNFYRAESEGAATR
jgi:hypothetical protein